MNTAKQILNNLLEDIPENELYEVIDFLGYLKAKREKEMFRDIVQASESSLEFWNNDVDDEVWNNV